MADVQLPQIIQGGMGVAVSDWRLARTVALAGQLGVVSGTGIDTVLVRRLQDGDPGGHMRRVMARFPIPGVADEMLERYFLPDGRAPGQPYALLPLFRLPIGAFRERLMMLAAFVEVALAKEGHSGIVGINLLTKIQMPNLAMLYGAILAHVDVVLMGAGIPLEIPAALDALAEHRPATLDFEIEGLEAGEKLELRFEPAGHWPSVPAPYPRPAFLPIIASNSLAQMLLRRAGGRIDGFVVEGPTAGGHNAPPRGKMQLNEQGEPIYGPRDEVDLQKLAELGLPFWVAGGAGSPAGLRQAMAQGATGIQVGTLFAYCDESGLAEEYKRSVLSAVTRGEVHVRTDPLASPTGYPFKVVTWLDEPTGQKDRARICDLGYLRSAYRTDKGTVGFRCPSEPIETYVKKGGDREATTGRKCLCNALMANIGLGQQTKSGSVEPPLLTSGDDLVTMGAFLAGRTSYTVQDVLDYLFQEEPAQLLEHAAGATAR